MDELLASIFTGTPERTEGQPSRLPAGSERVDPALFQAVLLDDLNRGIARLISLAEDQREAGYVWNKEPTTISGQSTVIPDEDGRFIRLFSVVITNDGAGSVDCAINNMLAWSRIEADDVFRVSFNHAVIAQIFLKPVDGSTPSVRLAGTY